MIIVIDHIVGSRRGQRQEFEPVDRLRFGRHPESEVSFDAHRDLDASSRHAELRRDGDRWVLRDVGSSNGLYVAEARVTEVVVRPGTAVEVAFGAEGPRLRLFIGERDQMPEAPSLSATFVRRATSRPRPVWIALAAVVVAGAIAAAIGLATCQGSPLADAAKVHGPGAREAVLSDNGHLVTGASSSRGFCDALPVV